MLRAWVKFRRSKAYGHLRIGVSAILMGLFLLALLSDCASSAPIGVCVR